VTLIQPLMKRLALIICLLPAIYNPLFSRNQYVYTQIAQEEGLTSTVNCIYKELDGDVWIGTPNGLYRFDGYSLNNFGNQLRKSKKIFHVDMDRHGTLWVLTDRHVLRQDAGCETFKKISHRESLFYSMTYDSKGLWIGGLDSIYRYTYSTDKFEAFCATCPGFDCKSINFINENTLLCCSPRGQFLIDINDRTVSEAHFGESKEVSAALIDNDGKIWLAFYNKGIEVFEKDGTNIKSYNTLNSSLSNNIVLCFTQKDSMILAGTDGGGINVINPKNDKITVLSHISGDRSSFPAHSIKSLHTDHYGNVWAGSIRDGLISISNSKITSYNDTYLGLTNGLSNPTVLCLHQDRTDGAIWIGTDGEGLNRFDPETRCFTHYKNTFKTKTVSIADYSDNELAISVYADKVYVFDKRNGSVRPMGIGDKSLNYQMKHSGRSINLYNENNGNILLFSNTIYRYDKSDGSCKHIAQKNGETSPSNFFVLGRSPEGVWLHNNFDIFLLKNNADTLTHRGHHKQSMIRSGHLAKDGIIWLATEEGLCKFDTSTDSFAHINTSVFSDANSVVCDNDSRVWVGTEKALSAYLVSSGSFTLFGKSDGAEPNEYLPKPHLLTSEGDVYLGGVQGLLHIRNDYVMENVGEPELKLDKVFIDGTRTGFLTEGSLLKVPRNSQTMDINMTVLERDMFRHRVFRFSFSGQTYETHLPQFSLQQMPAPGKYDITVSCTKRNGEWTEPTHLMTIKILQPWYLSWWFISGSLSLLILIFLTAIYSINRRKSDELKIAIKEQKQRVYEEKVKMLINISHELRTPLTLIMAPLKRLLKDMDSDLEEFPVLNRVYRQSVRMKNIIDMVLDLRKMEVGNNNLKIERQDYNTWISRATQDIVEEEKSSGIDILLDLDPDIGTVEYDRQKCDIVLTNILINAIKHSQPGDRIIVKVQRAENGMVRTSISDQGPGLGKDVDPAKMFTRFYQSTSEQYGSGIGLSYSKILVEMHGGNIGVCNNPDKGATFWWEIPVTAADGSISATEPHEYLNELLGHSSEADIQIPAKDDFTTRGMKLLLVDDNQDLLDFLREALCQDFAEITTVTGGNAALKEISADRLPDIIVSDVNMPDGDGYTLCRTLKESEKYRHIPIVLLTARGEEQSQSESYRLGADAFMGKPFEIETLMELLRNLLRNKSEIRKRYLDNDSAAESDYGSNEERFILQLNKIISEHLSDPGLDQQLICHEMGVSRALLYNKMKAITGAGTKEYIIKIRIEKAKSLVENTSLAIAEISEMTGFASQSYFSTAFKNYTGMTPSQFKQNCKAGKK